jgi:phosphatidylglycerophosphate synthase
MFVTAMWCAQKDNRWFWVGSAVILGQYLTDAIDGKVGQLRNDGLLRWGFYVDHVLDYVFLCSMLFGYALLVPSESQWLMTAAMALAGCFMASSFLACSLIGSLPISFGPVGPVEVRIILVLVNVWLAAGGRAALAVVLPVVLAACFAVLVLMVYRVQRGFWILERGERSAVDQRRREAMS